MSITNNQIKMIVFDLDGTLYDDSFYKQSYYEFAIAYMMKEKNISEGEAERLFLINDLNPMKTQSEKSITKYFDETGLDIQTWNDARQLFFSELDFSMTEKVSPDLIAALKDEYILILLTSNTRATTLKILDQISIKGDLFVEIITVEDTKKINKSTEKQFVFRELSRKYSLQFKQLLSIGNRFKTDIEPLEALGGVGLLVQGPGDIESYFEWINK